MKLQSSLKRSKINYLNSHLKELEKEEQISEIIDELIDRFGEIPTEVTNLIEIARIKILARNLKILSIIQKQENVVIRFSEDENNIADKIQILIDLYKNKIFFSGAGEPYIT